MGMCMDDDIYGPSYLRAELATLFHLGQGRRGGHDADDGDAQILAVPGQCEGVVASRGRDDSLLLGLWGQQHECVAAPSLLEAARKLREVLLQVDAAAADL